MQKDINSETQKQNEQQNTQAGVNIKMVCHSLLKIIARLDETQYTEGMLRQIEVREHPNPADPASECSTTQG